MQREENEIDLGSFHEIPEENKVVYNQAPVNTLIEDIKKLKNVSFAEGFSSLCEEGEIDTNRFFEDSNELAKFIDKLLNKYDNHHSIYYTGNFHRYFRIFKRANRAIHGRGVDEYNNFSEFEGEKCYKPSGNACFLKSISNIFRKDFSMDYFEFIQSYKKRTNVMTRCRIPEFCENYIINIGIYDPKSEKSSQGVLNRGTYV